MRPKHIASALLAVAALAPRAARAQTAGTIPPVQGALWQPELSVEPDAMPHVEGTRVPGTWNWNAGLAVDFLERPYAARPVGGGETHALVDWQLWTHALLQLGISPSMAVALDVPVLLQQHGDLAVFAGQGPLGTAGFGDVRAVWRWSTRTAASPHAGANTSATPPANRSASNLFVNDGPGLSVEVSATAPTGDGSSLMGSGAFGVHPRVIGDFRLFGLILAAQAGYHARIDGHWPGQLGDCPAPGAVASPEPTVSCLANVPLRDQITYGFGLRMPQGLLGGIVAAYFELVGAFDARAPGTPNTQPLELGIGAQRLFGEVTATLGVNTGVTDVPGNPRFRAMFMLQWAPRFVDEDGDGLRDNTGEDQCVGLPEDRDGYQDNDGCPEENDNDEVPDAEDRCPFQDEDVDGFQDEDGCPDLDNDRDGVPDAQDRCPNEAMGANPDEARPGCPNGDRDGDGVPNAQDACPDAPAGNTPDASRAGCPAADRDHDGVPDPIDACPDVAAELGARPEQHGCPETDHDHDGVPDAQDRCPEQVETLNGFEDDDGCAEAHPPATARARVRVVDQTAGHPGHVELLERVRFTPSDGVAPASDGLMAQLATALRATARNPWRHWTVTVMLTPASVRGPAAVDAARATRRRDAVLAALRAHGAGESVVLGAEPAAAPTTPVRNDRGIVLTVVETEHPAAVDAPSSAAAGHAATSATTTAPHAPEGAPANAPERAPAPAPPAHAATPHPRATPHGADAGP